MNLVNDTVMPAACTLGFERDGRELLIVAVKGTFAIPSHPGAEPVLAPEQVPLTFADEFTGEPGFSAPKAETDFAHRKPKCDILFSGRAYAPGGRPAERVTVSLQVGQLFKSFDVVGRRVWQAGALTISHSKPESFSVLPVSYDVAFGGYDRSRPDPAQHRCYLLNHAGVGWHEYLDTASLDGMPLPNTEEVGSPVCKPNGTYKPMALGPIGRAWQPRSKLAGTYDQRWLDTRCPFWPDDFDYAYFQAAPVDQQIPYPKGGEEIVLQNLSRDGLARFRLPRQPLHLILVPKQGHDIPADGVVDTVVIEPDRKRFTVTWRVSYPLRKNLFELKEYIVGRTVRKREDGTTKQHYKSMDDYARERKAPAAV